jgi:hypothetical protein
MSYEAEHRLRRLEQHTKPDTDSANTGEKLWPRVLSGELSPLQVAVFVGVCAQDMHRDYDEMKSIAHDKLVGERLMTEENWLLGFAEVEGLYHGETCE